MTVEVNVDDVVVSRAFLEQVGTALMAYASDDEEHYLAAECLQLADYPEDEDEEDYV